MKGKPKLRFAMMAVIMLVMMGALIWQLSNLTLANGVYYAEKAESRRTTTTYSTGSRGRILDRNGIPLAFDETSYNVQFSRDPERLSTADSALYTEALIECISIIEAGGGATIDTFYIKQDEEREGGYRYEWGVTAPDSIRARYKNFCQAMGLPMENADDDSTWVSADEAYKRLRKMWQIPSDMPFEQASKIMSIRQEVNMNKWRAYEPITIAYNVPMEVVAKLDMRKDELLGISTIQSTTRVYPWGATAAHIIGYLSRQVDNVTVDTLERMGYVTENLNLDELYALDTDGEIMMDKNGNALVNMTKMGYSYNDYIGVAGVERTMEQHLTASTNVQRGKQTIEINKHGSVTRDLEKTYAKNGNDVMLTIDLQLQRVTESALENAIKAIRAEEERLIAEDLALPPEAKKKYRNHENIRKADAGSIVVLDVSNGKLLAMASYPQFDPNVFLDTLSQEEADALFGDEANMPTLNRAIATRSAPGSIFKMATGLAGLMEGAITPETTYDDSSPYMNFVSGETIPEKDAPKCWVYPGTHKHADLNLSEALSKSCNYFFFTVADIIGINKLNMWATRLGLANKTGIELPGEQEGHVGGQSVLYDNTKLLDEQRSSLPYYVYRQLKKYLEGIVAWSGRDADEQAIEACAERLVELQDGVIAEAEYGEGIRRILRDELGIPITLTRSQNWVKEITEMLLELRWKGAMTIRTGMGQGITSVTPIALSRYAAALVNGGSVFDVHVVDRIIDENGAAVQVVEPTVHDQIDAPQEYWDAIQQGMKSVISDEDGTARKEFTPEFVAGGYRDQLIGKSGSAQISTAENNINIENTSWFISFLPADKPEIVIITCIPYGLSGSLGSVPAVEEIARFYIDRKSASAKENLVGLNELIP